MKRLVLTFALALLALPGLAQPSFSTQANQEYKNALTAATRFGVPRYATAALPTCATSNLGAVAYDTTAATLKVCSGSSWVSAGGATVGSPISGATADTILYADASGNLASSTWLAAFGAGAGTPTITFTKTMAGNSPTSNHFNLTSTIPASLSAAAHAVLIDTNAAADSDFQTGLTSVLTPIAGASDLAAIYGVLDAQSNASHQAGVAGAAYQPASGASSYGVLGSAKAGARGSGGLFFIHSGTAPSATVFPNPPSINGRAGLLASNSTTTDNIFGAYDNTTAVLVIADGGIVSNSPLGLTAATMTAENSANYRTATSSYTWTNAQVAALAGTAGDITVATLPAKTQVLDAAVVITGAAAGPTTVTVACGRTAADYIDYIVASDAKAAANTVYGDAAAERGTNLTGYDLPSYTGTTAVVCHFISTGANLSTTTGSTGRVILTTRLMP